MTITLIFIVQRFGRSHHILGMWREKVLFFLYLLRQVRNIVCPWKHGYVISQEYQSSAVWYKKYIYCSKIKDTSPLTRMSFKSFHRNKIYYRPVNPRASLRQVSPSSTLEIQYKPVAIFNSVWISSFYGLVKPWQAHETRSSSPLSSSQALFFASARSFSVICSPESLTHG